MSWLTEEKRKRNEIPYFFVLGRFIFSVIHLKWWNASGIYKLFTQSSKSFFVARFNSLPSFQFTSG